jgi:hypothetical protein
MNVGHTILLYVAVAAAMFIALDGLIEADHFSISKHNLPIKNDDLDWAPGSAKNTSLKTHYAMVCVFFGSHNPITPLFLTCITTRFLSTTMTCQAAHF